MCGVVKVTEVEPSGVNRSLGPSLWDSVVPVGPHWVIARVLCSKRARVPFPTLLLSYMTIEHLSCPSYLCHDASE